jgi:ubiquinone/menaquinone biosynthesis C-methylase UbiE
MKKSKLSDSQQFAMLNEAEGDLAVNDICRKYSIDNSTYYKLKSKHAIEEGEIYTLGDDIREQSRLHSQQNIYGDKHYIEALSKKNGRILEFGCGPGSNLYISSLCNEYVGTDISKKQIDKAKQTANASGVENAKFIIADGNRALPFNPGYFSMTFSRLVFVHLAEPMLMLKEMIRLTQPGGTVLSIEPDISEYYSSHKNLNKCFQARCKYAYEINSGSINIAKEIEQLFKLADLINIKTHNHEIYADSSNINRLKALQLNMLLMVETVKNEIINNGLVTEEEYDLATKEAKEISEDTILKQRLRITWGFK